MKTELKETGLLNKYNIAKTDGTQIDENSEYFVLRLDYGGSDPEHIKACRLAIITYAAEIAYHLPQLFKDIMERYGWETIARQIMQAIIYDNGFVDRYNPEAEALYPMESLNAIKEASRIFFSNHINYLTIKDINTIAIGCHDEIVAEYGRFSEYKELETTINDWYENVLKSN